MRASLRSSIPVCHVGLSLESLDGNMTPQNWQMRPQNVPAYLLTEKSYSVRGFNVKAEVTGPSR
jgi:hypothetical protein